MSQLELFAPDAMPETVEPNYGVYDMFIDHYQTCGEKHITIASARTWRDLFRKHGSRDKDLMRIADECQQAIDYLNGSVLKK